MDEYDEEYYEMQDDMIVKAYKSLLSAHTRSCGLYGGSNPAPSATIVVLLLHIRTGNLLKTVDS